MSYDRQLLQDVLSEYPALSALVDGQLAVWPKHEHFLATRFGADDPKLLATGEELAALALRIIGQELVTFCQDYEWMCERFNEEQFYFAKTGRYRLRSFEEAYTRIYNDSRYMSRYVHGILLSQIFWRNHTCAADFLRRRFIPANVPGYRHLEVGPGHGLFLYFAATDPVARSITGWDVSRSSLDATRECLARFGISDRVALIERDVLDPAIADNGVYDSIVVSEVLEHLEQPVEALAVLKCLLSEDGRLLVNIPVNSPAPDHIFLWRSIEDVRSTVRSVGLEIVDAEVYPVTGYTVEEAIRRRLAISCVITCVQSNPRA